MTTALRLEADGAHTLAIAVVDEALAEVRAEMASLHTEMREGQESLRVEMREGQAALRAEMRENHAMLHAELVDVRTSVGQWGERAARLEARLGVPPGDPAALEQ